MRSHSILASLLGAGMALLISLPSSADQAPIKERIDKLIEQLGSGSFAEREKASEELAAIGVPALEALRKAAKSEDAEVRKRVEDILPRIERQAESARLLVAKRVHLIYKDAPLAEAVTDFGKKSGYSIELHDPDSKLKERKITLDSGETTFWHAFGLFCDKAEMSEASLDDLLQMPQAPGGIAGGPPGGPPPVIIKPVRGFMPGNVPGMMGRMGQLILKGGKAKALPTDDRSAARIRVLGKSDQFGRAPEGEIILALEVSLEPKLQWQAFQSIHIDKAVDDEDRQLAQVIPQVEGAPGIAGNPAIVLQGQAGVQQMQAMMQLQARRRMIERRMGWSGLNQQVPLQLKKGAKAAKSLKELQGVLTAQVLTEARPVLTADNLEKAAGKTFKGQEGGSIKIVDVKAEENQTTIQLEFEQPPYDRVMPAQPNVLPGVGIRNVAPRGMLRPPPPPAPPAGKLAQPPGVQRPAAKNPPGLAPVVRAGSGPRQRMDSISGLSIQDDKGQTLPLDGGRCQVTVQMDRQANGPAKQVLIWTLVCPHEKEKAKPSKVVYLGRKNVTIEIPFALKDVPLP